MFCPKCGNQLNDGAAFCQKCGTKVPGSGNSSTNIPDNRQLKGNFGNPENHGVPPKGSTVKPNRSVGKKKNNKVPIIIACVAVLIIIIFAVMVSGGNGTVLQPSWVKANKNNGADNPIEIAAAFLETMNDGDPSRLYKYWDAQLSEEGRNLDTDSLEESHQKATNFETETLYLDGAEYEVGNVYTSEKDGKSYEHVKVNINCRTEGMFGGESVFTGYDYSVEITLHKNRTPDGDKWFIGPMGGQWGVAQ